MQPDIDLREKDRATQLTGSLYTKKTHDSCSTSVSVPLPPFDSTSVRIISGWQGRNLAMLMSNFSVSDGEDIIAAMAD